MTEHIFVGDGKGGLKLRELNPPIRGGTPEMEVYLRERGYMTSPAQTEEQQVSDIRDALSDCYEALVQPPIRVGSPLLFSVGEWRMFQNHIFWYGVFASAIAFVITVVAGGVTIN